MSERLFVDTSAYYALTDPDSAEHARARATFQHLATHQAQLYATNFVASETHALILNRVNRDVAERVLDRLYAGATRVIRAMERDETHVREIIHQYRDKEYSLVDAISFAVMERLHLRNVWTYDHHFAQYGFTLIG